MNFAQITTVVTVIIAAISALFSLVSARAARASVEAFRSDVELSRDSTRVQLARTFEDDYARQYDQISKAFGPWKDPVAVDSQERRVVHDMLASLASIYMANQVKLIDDTHAKYVYVLFADWLRLPRPHRIWTNVFAVQPESWPPGFVDCINGLIVTRTQAD
jgi:hypothetical protein